MRVQFDAREQELSVRKLVSHLSQASRCSAQHGSLWKALTAPQNPKGSLFIYLGKSAQSPRTQLLSPREWYTLDKIMHHKLIPKLQNL